MKQGEKAELRQTKAVLTHIFSQISANPKLREALAAEQSGSAGEDSAAELVHMALQLAHYVSTRQNTV